MKYFITQWYQEKIFSLLPYFENYAIKIRRVIASPDLSGRSNLKSNKKYLDCHVHCRELVMTAIVAGWMKQSAST
jgi:hypothetical protein